MPQRRASNLTHSDWNKRCRERLSRHIDTLHWVIEPSRIRLKTENTDDPYLWDKLKEKDDLFKTNLSQQSLAGLKELYYGVGVSFRAIPKASFLGMEYEKCSAAPASMACEQNGLTPSPVSFRSRISQMQQENMRLAVENHKLETELEQVREGKQKAEDQIIALQKISLHNQNQTQKHLEELERCYSVMEYLRKALTDCNEGLVKVLPMLDKVAQKEYHEHDDGI